MAHWSSHDQRRKGHQEKSQPANETQTQKQKTLVYVISILNVTRYATQVNRQHINTVMEVVERTHNDITTLFNIMNVIYACINYEQILLHISSILANL